MPASLRDDSIRLLQDLLRLDTTSPPGNERLAADYIAEELKTAGIESTIIEAAPGRATIVARLKAEHPTGRPVMLMGHTDVVTVERDKWDRDPFSGDLIDGYLWGRGALDMKDQVAGNLAAFIAIKQANLPLTRDLILCAFADEEAGGEFGADWVWKNHRDLIDAEFALNEGGGAPVEIAGHMFSTCQVGENGSSRLLMTVRGEPGHASVPIPDSAMEKLGIALTRLHAWRPHMVITASTRRMLSTIGSTLGGQAQALIDGILSASEPSWDTLTALPLEENDRLQLYAITHNTAVPTIIGGGQRINVIPSEIKVDIDGRILPGQDPEAFAAEVQAAVGDVAEITLVKPDTGVEADPDSAFFDAIVSTMARLQPEATVIPNLISGGTDAALIPGVKVYGFFPFPPSDRIAGYDKLVHGHNERIHVDDLAFATQFLYEIVADFCTR